jgi:ABC-2 type transport system permease protein
VSRPGTHGWFARHEARLAWRDWLSLMTAGRRRRARTVAIGFIVFAFAVHGLAYLMLGSATNLRGPVDTHVLVVISFVLALVWSLMLSQAMESVTRAFYARGDLELILTSPAAAARLFAVRATAIAVTVLFLALVLGAPFINVLAWYGGAHWLGAYAVAVALAMDAVALAVVITIALFRAIGPRRTRGIAQVIAAVVGAAFVIGMQFAAILSFGGMPRMAVLQLAALVKDAPDADSALWWPARAFLGEKLPLVTLLGVSIVALAVAVRLFAPRFGRLALATTGLAPAGLAPAGLAPVGLANFTMPRRRRQSRFRSGSPMQALRRKEWTLLWRDPWLMSQTLMQLLYLLPPAFLLWRGTYAGDGTSALLVPVLIVAAGQLGGGLAWLAVSGEDAPELIASAPVSQARILWAKAQAVLGGIAVIFAPFGVALAITAPFAALVACVGVAVAAGSATAIQYWFRTQARRSLFRRRQTSSRVATIAEALASIGWAGTGALAAAGLWLAAVSGVIVLAIVAGAWVVSPARSPAAM